MEKENIRVLIVEDDMIIGANLSLMLSSLGYEVSGLVPRGEEALVHVRDNPPQLLLLDINLKGSLDGIETAKAVQKLMDIPIVYLTANSDDATFERAKQTQPKAFITKPFNKLNLQRTLALVAQTVTRQQKPIPTSDFEFLEDRIFIRHNGKMTKLLLDDILYLEADRNYCVVVCDSLNYTLSNSLKVVADKLPESKFVRVHRSYMVNISKLDSVAEDHIEIKRKSIPLSKGYKESLMRRLRTI